MSRKVEVGAAPTVAVTDQLVYVSSPDGRLSALDPATGALRWSAAVRDVSRWGSTPTVVGGMVYLPSRVLYAFDATTGALHWTARSGGTPDYAFAPLTILGPTVYLPGGDGLLHRVDITTGRPRSVDGTLPHLPRDAAGVDALPPAAADGVIYLGSCDRRFYAYSAE